MFFKRFWEMQLNRLQWKPQLSQRFLFSQRSHVAQTFSNMFVYPQMKFPPVNYAAPTLRKFPGRSGAALKNTLLYHVCINVNWYLVVCKELKEVCTGSEEETWEFSKWCSLLLGWVHCCHIFQIIIAIYPGWSIIVLYSDGVSLTQTEKKNRKFVLKQSTYKIWNTANFKRFHKFQKLSNFRHTCWKTKHNSKTLRFFLVN